MKNFYKGRTIWKTNHAVF